MDIKELKKRIETNSITDEFMIFQYKDDSSLIIIDQYISLICKHRSLNKKMIESMNDIPDMSFIQDDNLYILNQDEFNDDTSHSNCIVICKKTNNKSAIKIPNLEYWQVEDFLIPKLSGLTKEEINSFAKLYMTNYRLLLNDSEKISIFPETLQKQILVALFNDNQFSHVTDISTFDFTNAIIKRDINTIKEILSKGSVVDITPMHILTILTNSFRNIVNIQLDPTCTYSSLGISDKQFFVIKKFNCGYYSKEKLIEIYKMLTSIEYKFKFEELDMNDVVDYILVNILKG